MIFHRTLDTLMQYKLFVDSCIFSHCFNERALTFFFHSKVFIFKALTALQKYCFKFILSNHKHQELSKYFYIKLALIGRRGILGINA